MFDELQHVLTFFTKQLTDFMIGVDDRKNDDVREDDSKPTEETSHSCVDDDHSVSPSVAVDLTMFEDGTDRWRRGVCKDASVVELFFKIVSPIGNIRRAFVINIA